MANIYIVHGEALNIPLEFNDINGWFDYAYHGIEAIGLKNFPEITFDVDYLNFVQANKKTHKLSEKNKYEEIFRLPRLEIHYNSKIINSNLI